MALFFSAFSNALFKSFNKSSASSMPQLMRTKSSGKPRAALTSAGILACDMKHGKEIKLVTPPKETVILNSFVSSTIVLEKLTSPVVKERMLPRAGGLGEVHVVERVGFQSRVVYFLDLRVIVDPFG